MTEEKHEVKRASERIGSLNSKLLKTTLVVLAALLTFAGPTYVVYVLSFLDISFTISVVCGFILFVAGLTLFWYLIKNKVIS